MNLEIRQSSQNDWYLFDLDTQDASIDFDERHSSFDGAQDYLDMMLMDYGTDAENGMV